MAAPRTARARTKTACLNIGILFFLTATFTEAYWGSVAIRSITSAVRGGQGLPTRRRYHIGALDTIQSLARGLAKEGAGSDSKGAEEVSVRNRYCKALSMGRASREGGVVLQSLKVGPLKQENVCLPSGLLMDMLSQAPSTSSIKRSKALPPLVFIHGSFHSAWCWAEHWMPFLASKGYETYSMSLRGTSGTPPPETDGAAAKIKISEHVADVKGFVKTVLPGRKPVFVSHSFGGIVVLKLMEELAGDTSTSKEGEGMQEDSETAGGVRAKMAGSVFLCSVPPSGNGPMTKRFMKERPFTTVKILLGFVLKMAVVWPWLARSLFFTESLERATLRRYLSYFKADSKNGLDLGDLRKQLPSRLADADGKAKWVDQAPPRLVVGAERDQLLDEAGVEEMAKFLDTEHFMLPTVPHEVMLGTDWPVGVARVHQWLENTEFDMAPTT